MQTKQPQRRTKEITKRMRPTSVSVNPESLNRNTPENSRKKFAIQCTVSVKTEESITWLLNLLPVDHHCAILFDERGIEKSRIIFRPAFNHALVNLSI